MCNFIAFSIFLQLSMSKFPWNEVPINHNAWCVINRNFTVIQKKNFVKSTHISLVRGFFHKSFAKNFRNFNTMQCTLWKLQKFYLTLFSQKFRESNGFTKEITTLQSRIRVAPRLFILEEKYDHYNLIKSTIIIYFLQNWIFSPITWIFPPIFLNQ